MNCISIDSQLWTSPNYWYLKVNFLGPDKFLWDIGSLRYPELNCKYKHSVLSCYYASNYYSDLAVASLHCLPFHLTLHPYCISIDSQLWISPNYWYLTVDFLGPENFIWDVGSLRYPELNCKYEQEICPDHNLKHLCINTGCAALTDDTITDWMTLDGHTAPSVCNYGYVPLSHLGNIDKRIEQNWTEDHNLWYKRDFEISVLQTSRDDCIQFAAVSCVKEWKKYSHYFWEYWPSFHCREPESVNWEQQQKLNTQKLIKQVTCCSWKINVWAPFSEWIVFASQLTLLAMHI